MSTDKNGKARTTITIKPDLWARSKSAAAKVSPKKLSFSAFVELALLAYLEKEGQ